MDTLLLLTGVSASLAVILYLIAKVFSITEYREKKRKTMFDWVSSNLFDKVYEPLKQSANEISEALTSRGHWKGAAKDYQTDVLLFSIAKFLHYAFKNREKVGKDEFFTRSDLSNDYLSRLLNNIIEELKTIICISESFEGGDRDKSAVTKLYFLATCGKAKNFSEFNSLIEGRLPPYYLQGRSERGETSIAFLKEETNLLKYAYSEKGYLSRVDSVNYSMFTDVVGKILNENDRKQRWVRAKLYAYCSLFHKLLHYEIHRMYDTWYVGYPEDINLNELFYTIEKVFAIMELKEDSKRKFLDTNPTEKYTELCNKYNGLYIAEQTEIETTKSILKGIGKVNSKTLNNIKKKREVELDIIRKDMREIEKIGFIGSEEEIPALYDISLDKNKLFEEGVKTHPIKRYMYFRRILRYLKHFSCSVIFPLFFAVLIAGLISFSGIQNIVSDKTITISQIATIVILPYFIVFLLTFIHISINYLFSNIEVNWRIFWDKIKRALYTSSCIAVIALAACIILSFW